jgi:glycerol kinase
MRADIGGAFQGEPVIRVDGGMTASDWTLQFLADMLAAPVDRPTILETTALGVAFLAGWRAGLFAGPEAFANTWRLERRFEPAMQSDQRAIRYNGWLDAVARSLFRKEP